MYFIGVIIVLLGVSLGFVLKGVTLAMFVNPSAVGMILFVIVGVIVATSGNKTFVRGLNAVLSSQYVIDDEERKKAADLFRLLSKSVLLTSVIGILIGLIAILTNLNNPEMLAHALSAAIISPIFGSILVVAIFEPAVYVLKKPR